MSHEEDFLISPEQLETIKTIFKTFDTDNDGKLKSDELEPALRAYSLNPTPEEIQSMIEDCEGEIDIDGFVYIIYYHSRSSTVEDDLIDSFSIFDKEGTGKLNVKLITKILKNIKIPFNDSQINDLLQKVPHDDDFVNYSDLVQKMLNL